MTVAGREPDWAQIIAVLDDWKNKRRATQRFAARRRNLLQFKPLRPPGRRYGKAAVIAAIVERMRAS